MKTNVLYFGDNPHVLREKIEPGERVTEGDGIGRGPEEGSADAMGPDGAEAMGPDEQGVADALRLSGAIGEGERPVVEFLDEARTKVYVEVFDAGGGGAFCRRVFGWAEDAGGGGGAAGGSWSFGAPEDAPLTQEQRAHFGSIRAQIVPRIREARERGEEQFFLLDPAAFPQVFDWHRPDGAVDVDTAVEMLTVWHNMEDLCALVGVRAFAQTGEGPEGKPVLSIQGRFEGRSG